MKIILLIEFLLKIDPYNFFLHISCLLCKTGSVNLWSPVTQPVSRQGRSQKMTPGRAPSIQCTTEVLYPTVHYTSEKTFKVIQPLPGAVKGILFTQFFVFFCFQRDAFSRNFLAPFMSDLTIN